MKNSFIKQIEGKFKILVFVELEKADRKKIKCKLIWQCLTLMGWEHVLLLCRRKDEKLLCVILCQRGMESKRKQWSRSLNEEIIYSSSTIEKPGENISKNKFPHQKTPEICGNIIKLICANLNINWRWQEWQICLGVEGGVEIDSCIMHTRWKNCINAE